jgi:hypothetical protein
MVLKTDFVPALHEQHALHQSQKFSAVILRQPALKFIYNTGLAILTVFAILSGFPGWQDNLEEMGVSLGPNHW